MTTKLLPFLFLFASCVYDPPSPRVEIVNSSEKEFTLELGFDANTYKSSWSEKEFQAFLNYPYGHSYPGPEVKFISFDPEHLVQVYTIPPKATYAFVGWETDDDSVLYNRMRFISNKDTMTLENLAQVKKMFKKTDKYTSRLELK